MRPDQQRKINSFWIFFLWLRSVEIAYKTNTFRSNPSFSKHFSECQPNSDAVLCQDFKGDLFRCFLQILLLNFFVEWLVDAHIFTLIDPKILKKFCCAEKGGGGSYGHYSVFLITVCNVVIDHSYFVRFIRLNSSETKPIFKLTQLSRLSKLDSIWSTFPSLLPWLSHCSVTIYGIHCLRRLLIFWDLRVKPEKRKK